MLFSENMNIDDNASDSSDDEGEVRVRDGDEETEVGLMIAKNDADKNYMEAWTLVDEPPYEISLEKYGHLLSDSVHIKIKEVLNETGITFKLADFQKWM